MQQYKEKFRVSAALPQGSGGINANPASHYVNIQRREFGYPRGGESRVAEGFAMVRKSPGFGQGARNPRIPGEIPIQGEQAAWGTYHTFSPPHVREGFGVRADVNISKNVPMNGADLIRRAPRAIPRASGNMFSVETLDTSNLANAMRFTKDMATKEAAVAAAPPAIVEAFRPQPRVNGYGARIMQEDHLTMKQIMTRL